MLPPATGIVLELGWVPMLIRWRPTVVPRHVLVMLKLRTVLLMLLVVYHSLLLVMLVAAKERLIPL